MASRTTSIAALSALLLGASHGALAQGGPGLLQQAYSQAWKGNRSVQYEAPSTAELTATRDLFARILRGERGRGIDELAQSAGWRIRSQPQDGGDLVVVSEAPGEIRGRGLYAFFSQGRHALQAPHVPTDGLTGEILLEYAQDRLPRALAWNTVPRSRGDMAHLFDTDFIEFSRAFALAHPNEKIIQLHGFDADDRKTEAASGSGAIVSATHRRPSNELRQAVNCLRDQVESATRLYGEDVRELGGTTNTVAKALRAGGYEHFIHLEAALPLRERLLADATQRRALFVCLGGRP